MLIAALVYSKYCN